MPSLSLRLVPGVDTNRTPAQNEAGISSSNNIRFRAGMIQKRGGYTLYPGAGGLSGVPRALCSLIDSNSDPVLAIGATNHLGVVINGVYQEITPVIVTATSTTIANPTATGFVQPGISTTAGSGTLTIQDQNYGVSPNDTVAFRVPVAVGGITFGDDQNRGAYTVQSVIDANHYTISLHNLVATTTVSNTFGLPVYTTTAGSRLVTVSLPNYVVRNNFHIRNAVSVGGLKLQGGYSVTKNIDANTFVIDARVAATTSATATANNGVFPAQYNTSRVVTDPATTTSTSYTSTPITSPDWSLSAYGNQLIAVAAGNGLMYQWSAGSSSATAQLITDAPVVSGIIVSDAQQQVIGYGAPASSGSDPNYVVWSDTGNIQTWTAAIGNQAGSYRIPTGSGVLAAAQTSQQVLLWTDLDVWSMSYIGYPLVYGFNKLATGCGILAQNAWVKAGSAVYWMSQNEFWVYPLGGVPQQLPCPVSDSVFPNIDPNNAWKIRAGANAQFDEAIWFFPSVGGSGENDTYVSYNVVENAWDVGSITRSAWIDQSVLGAPLGADPTGIVYQHETSVDAAGSPLAASFTTGFFQIADGEEFAFIDWIRPDFKDLAGDATIFVTVLVADYAGDTPEVHGPYPFTRATDYVETRCRGRFAALKFESADAGTAWRIGRMQIRYAIDGRR